ncbi:MAG: type IIA DNA topoisomerase subunit B [Bacteroidales bacterium]|nr:type IIA DNA topoisomerase subunit B [Bacteroidales bacterium]
MAEYSEDSIKTLEWKEHIRRRPGMYIGKLGDGTSADDGIYILLKETIDNSIDEFMMGNGKKIDITITEHTVTLRDYGRGIPLGKVLDVSSKMNTGAKYDSEVFKKAVGLNGVGIKAVNALSTYFIVKSYREGEVKSVEYSKGAVVNDAPVEPCDEPNGVFVKFRPDIEVFGEFKYIFEYVETMLRNYTYLNTGLTINFNGKKFISKNGLLDLLNENIDNEPVYPPIHLRGTDIELAFTHESGYGEDYHSFVNGQHTTQGGTHLVAFREAIVKTIREFYNKTFDATDIRQSIVAAIAIRVQEPIFESQTKTKLGSKDIGPDGPTVQKFINDFVKTALDNFLHKNAEIAEVLLKKIQDSERERKAMAGVQKIAKERAKKASLHNKKLRDCRAHFNSNHEKREKTCIFITEGDSASGSITKSRDVNTQAVFSLRGKPLNTLNKTKKIVYENEEFSLLQAALNIEDGIENLRYRNVIIATDADVDGMHIRLLLITFFLNFFPELVKKGHVAILQTPLFRVRNKKETRYCYSPEEKAKALEDLKPNPEITRFKGLGEISPDEFQHFIGENMRLEPVILNKDISISELLNYFMGDNTPERRDFIVENLRIEDDVVEHD